jgi:hypothetical protein
MISEEEKKTNRKLKKKQRVLELKKKKQSEYYKKYKENNLESIRENSRKYRIEKWWVPLHAKCSERNRKRKKQLAVIDFDSNYIKELYDKQEGKCYWLGIQMNPDKPARHCLKPSLDRLDNNVGYIKSNIVLCTILANNARNSTPVDEWIEICNMLKVKHKFSETKN